MTAFTYYDQHCQCGYSYNRLILKSNYHRMIKCRYSLELNYAIITNHAPLSRLLTVHWHDTPLEVSDYQDKSRFCLDSPGNGSVSREN